MSAAETSFDGVASEFAEYGEQVRGFVRYALVQRNLQPYLNGDTCRVVDIGGGTAIDAAWIAALGHEVTVIEPSTEQIEKGKKRLSELPEEVRSRITIIQGTAEDLLASGEANKYDMALSHCVAMYLEDPEGFIADVALLVRDGGHISLLEKGYYGQEARLIRQKKIKELVNFQATKKVVNNMGRSVRAFYPSDLEDALSKADVGVVEWTGVRLITDNDTRPIDSLRKTEREAIIEAEYTQGKNSEIRGQGQLYHFIGKKQQKAES